MTFSFNEVDKIIEYTSSTINSTTDFNRDSNLYVGVDLGTAYIVLVVVDENGYPIATELKYAEVVRDGLVIDYSNACLIVKELKSKLEERLNTELSYAAIAMPPGTYHKDIATHRYVVESAGFEVLNIIEEPEAANVVLNIKDGAVVDVGGGTTGVAVFKDGKMVYTADEATGGTHLTLTIAGNYGISFLEAEKKKKSNDSKEIIKIVTPVIQKISSIIKKHVVDYDVENIFLVGGTVCLEGFEDIVERETGIKTFKPKNPFLVTPLGIAKSLVQVNLVESINNG